MTRAGVPLETLRQFLTAETDECLLWPHTKWQRGYGVVVLDSKRRSVHAVVCESHHGPRPSVDHEVAHSCGVPNCGNHRHVRWATHAENMADKVLHGSQRGQLNPSAKLTEADVIDIRRRASSKGTATLLAREYGVARETITSILRGKSWAWLDLPITK